MTTEQRKLVSIVFADVVGSTVFGSDHDPEAVRSVMGSYFERMKAIAETHGGTVDDDDAERAVRALTESLTRSAIEYEPHTAVAAKGISQAGRGPHVTTPRVPRGARGLDAR